MSKRQESGVPSEVVSALARHRRSGVEDHGPARTGVVCDGDLVVVRPVPSEKSDSRIALVLAADHGSGHAEVLLVHSASEMATACDAVLPSEAVSAPFDVVVQTDLRGVVWQAQTGRRVGRLDRRSLEFVRAIMGEGQIPAISDCSWSDMSTGIEMAGPLDGRWAFKESEGEALRALTADCTATMLDCV